MLDPSLGGEEGGEIDHYEWKEGEKPYREWLLPAAIIELRKVSVEVVDEFAEDFEP